MFGLVASFAWPVAAAEPAPSYRNEVMALLAKTGCNQGACHGSARGKGGFQLSLRGQDPADDFLALTRELGGRRVNRLDPASSLLLRKATMQISHVGGRRLTADSPEYRLLHHWIANGAIDDGDRAPALVSLNVTPAEAVLVAPEWHVTLQATATFGDGTTRDVTPFAVFEAAQPTVEISANGTVIATAPGENTVLVRYLHKTTPVRLAFVAARPADDWTGPAAANGIDDLVLARQRALRRNVAPVTDDVTFLRRATLDLIGRLPTAHEARRFSSDPSSDKRSRWIDTLLEHEDFSWHWSQKWADMLRIEEKTLDERGVKVTMEWLRQRIQDDAPLDETVRLLVSGLGSTYENPPANFYRALRDPQARAESTAQIFLGVRLQCARCHNHPFDEWTQSDYYAWSNVFARIDYDIKENKRKDSNDKHEFRGEQIVLQKSSGDVNDPRTSNPQPPRVLQAGEPAMPEDANRIETMAAWLTQRDHRRFSRMLANRVWFYVMGRGLVDPVDDLRATNPPVHAELLERLTDAVSEHDFRLRPLIRLVMNSHIYQAGYQADATNAEDETGLTHTVPRRLTAEQLLDAMAQVCEQQPQFAGQKEVTRAAQLVGTQALEWRYGSPSRADRFLRLFGKPQRLQNCDCERSSEPTLTQTFALVGGDVMQNMVTATDNSIGRQLAASRSDDEILDELYWAALSRAPQSSERERVLHHVATAADLRLAWEDVLWSLLNSDEFLLRR